MTDAQALFQEREKRFNDAVALRVPDRVPICTLLDYFPVKYNGRHTIKEVMYDHQLMFDIWFECIQEFEPDNVENPFTLYGFGSVLDALDFQHLKWAGHGLGDDMSYQFVELENMKAEEYDHFIFDPADFLIRRFWPRVNKALAPLETLPPINQVISYFWGMHNSVFLLTPEMEAARKAVIKAGEESRELLGWSQKFSQKSTELGFPEAFGGLALVPFDALGDIFRGTKGIMMDLFRRPEKILAACEKLLPIIFDAAVSTCKLTGIPRVFIPLHKCLDSFMSEQQFLKFYWPQMKELMESLIKEGLTPVVLVEGVCNKRLKFFKDVPPGKVVYHIEQSDIFKAKEIMRDTCCLRGNVPTSLLATGKPEQVREYCKKLIDVCGEGGGFIMDCASNLTDSLPENARAMFEVTKEYGIY